MGQTFVAFGRYLSSRDDLQLELLGNELANIPEVTPPVALAEIRDLFRRELGCAPEEAFEAFDPQPFQSRLLYQTHHGRLGDRDVIIKIIRPEIGVPIPDLDYLTVLEKPLATFGVPALSFQAALADFQRLLAEAQTFEAEFQAFRLLSSDSQEFDLLGVQRIHTHLSSPRVAVYDRCQSLETMAAPATDLARSLCTVWLRQSLQGSVYPVEPSAENIGFTPDGRIVFTAGPFATLPEALKASLWNYLVAVSTGDVDGTGAYLAAAIGSSLTDSAREDLRRQIRQMVPFREGFRAMHGSGWSGEEPPFSEQVRIHWRIANENCVMSDALISFYRGLFAIMRMARGWAPGRDSLAEAVRDLRLLTAIGQIKDVLRPSRMAGLMEDYAKAFVGMPESLDRVLTSVATGLLSSNPETRTGKQQEENTDSRYVRMLCVLLALAAASMLLHKIVASSGATAGRMAAIVFLPLGLYLLRVGVR
jgi:hypothetical protein